MASTLKLILEIFEETSRPLSLPEMARALGLEQNMLDSMIEYWVRKGKIREASDSSGKCTLCDERRECPFVVKMPRRFELATNTSREQSPDPPCSCCG